MFSIGDKVYCKSTNATGTIIDYNEVEVGTQSMPDYVERYLVEYRNGTSHWYGSDELQKLHV